MASWDRCALGLVLLVTACDPGPPSTSETTSTTTTGVTTGTGVTPTSGPPAPTPTSTTAVTPQDSTVGSADTSTSTGKPGSGDSPGLFDLGIPDAPVLPPRTPPWLVHMANVGSERHLFQIDIDTAMATDVCTVIDTATMMPYSGGSPSLTFTRDDRLLFSTGSNLYEIELPSCMAMQLGSIGFTGVNGISPDEGDDLYGLSSNSDVLIHIDAQTGMGTQIGALGGSWGMLGGTWNELEQQILGINSVTDSLYEIDNVTGMASALQMLSLDFATVGVEFHPLTEQIYACTSDSHLYRLEGDGSLTDLGDMGFDTCTNLGAPWSEDVVLPTPS